MLYYVLYCDVSEGIDISKTHLLYRLKITVYKIQR